MTQSRYFSWNDTPLRGFLGALSKQQIDFQISGNEVTTESDVDHIAKEWGLTKDETEHEDAHQLDSSGTSGLPDSGFSDYGAVHTGASNVPHGYGVPQPGLGGPAEGYAAPTQSGKPRPPSKRKARRIKRESHRETGRRFG